MDFKHWILNEMAFVSKEPIYLDEDDILYLKQFPLKDWNRALKYRYNDLLLSSIQNGTLVNKKDKRLVEISHFGKTYQILVNSGIVKLFKKLKNLKFDFSGSNSQTRDSLFYNPLPETKAHYLARDLKNTISPEKIKIYQNEISKIIKKKVDWDKETVEKVIQLNKLLDPKPNLVYFIPNYVKTSRNDAEPSKDKKTPSLLKKFNEIKQLIPDTVKNKLHYISNSFKTINVFYWQTHIEKLIELIEQEIWLNFKEEKYQDINFLRKIIYNKIIGKLQNGYISRRNEESLVERGVVLKNLLNTINKNTNKNWTLEEILQVLNTYKNHDQRAQAFLQK